MARTILSRYLNPDVLTRIAGRRLDPRGLVLGNLAGSHKSPLSGFAVEFAGHREYAWGDDPKHIDWRIYYTRDRYFVKQYEMETNLVCHFMLDSSASMRYGEGQEQKLGYAAQMIAALGYAVVHQSDKVSLATFDEEIRGVVPPSNSMAQIIRMAELLEGTEPVHKTHMAHCLIELVGRTKRREIVMIFSDFFTELPPLESALQQLRYRRHETVLFQVMHHDELHFDFDQMTKFVGLEIPEELLTHPERIRRAYMRAMEGHNRRLEDICQRNRIERVLVDTRRDLGEVLVDYMNHRSRLNRGR
ncbi:MAG: DUF58 domain-containing protein [Thermoguttaceae bacterium]|jgi:uncharacterized protein (DUF58 family)